MKDAVRLFKALGDPTRLRIVKLLEQGELCVCQLTQVLGMGQSRISRHLAILKQAGLIEGRREGKWVHYCLCTSSISDCLAEGWIGLDGDDAIKRDRRSVDKAKTKPACPLHAIRRKGARQ